MGGGANRGAFFRRGAPTGNVTPLSRTIPKNLLNP